MTKLAGFDIFYKVSHFLGYNTDKGENKEMPILYSKKEAAKMLGISVETLDRYWKKGELSYREIGDRKLFAESDLAAFSDAHAVPATANPTEREKLEIAKAGKRGKTPRKTLITNEQGSPIYDYGVATLELSSPM